MKSVIKEIGADFVDWISELIEQIILFLSFMVKVTIFLVIFGVYLYFLYQVMEKLIEFIML